MAHFELTIWAALIAASAASTRQTERFARISAGVRGPFFWVLRMSGGLRGGVGCVFAAKFSWQMPPCQGGKDAVFDAWRELVGPFIDGLICHSDRCGCRGGGAAE
ncbi:hypothetical protein [Variovorax sp. V15]|uniref:hypothetical protein n=1 Tax=Variovorax sp. V15 TaxID=3065952 RepID=UPI0034E873FA